MIERNRWLQVGQVCLLLLGAWLLFHWRRERPPVVMSDDAVDDLIEEVGDTYVPVHVGQIQRGTLRHYVTAYGIVAPAAASAGNEAASADITSPMTATVASVQCVERQLIAKGAPLFTLDSRSADSAIVQAQQILDADQAAVARIDWPKATTQAATQSTTLATATTRPSMDALPAWRLAEAQRQVSVDAAELHRLQEQRKLLAIAAPIAGTVTRLNISAGDTLEPGKVAVKLVDLDRLVATVDVPAQDLSYLKAGQTASIDLRSANSTTQPSSITGNVVLIDPTINPSTGMGSADVALPAGSGLRPGQFVRAQIVTGQENGRLMVPTQSITQNKNGDPAVGLVETDGRWAVLVPVTTGWRDGDQTEIAGQGLDAGEQVVTIGANGLVQRTRLHLLRD